MDNGLTGMGYDQIIERILNRPIDPPKQKTCVELTAWLMGYSECMNGIVKLIRDMKDQYGR